MAGAGQRGARSSDNSSLRHGELELLLNVARPVTAPPTWRGLAARAELSQQLGSSGGPVILGARYELGRRLGQGGMGVVWLAHDRELDRMVAIKTLRASPGAQDPERLVREARLAAAAATEGVVEIFDVGVHEGVSYFVMEYIEGGDLRRWLQTGPRRPWQARLAPVLEAGQALEATHAAGIIHGDFKPSNVLLDPAGGAKITDFGLARDRAEVTALSSEPLLVIGTPPYLAPEDHECSHRTPASDAYALAATAFEALYGRAPFPERDAEQLLSHKRSGPPQFPRGADVPRRIRAVLARALDPDPRRRYGSVADLVAALQPVRASRWTLPLVSLLGPLLAVGALGLDSTKGPERCREGRHAASNVWQGAQTRIGAASLGSSAQTSHDDLQQYASRWDAVHDDTCRAASAEYAVLACLDEQLDRYRVHVELASRRGLTHAVRLDDLAAPEDCRSDRIVGRVELGSPAQVERARRLRRWATETIAGVHDGSVSASVVQARIAEASLLADPLTRARVLFAAATVGKRIAAEARAIQWARAAYELALQQPDGIHTAGNVARWSIAATSRAGNIDEAVRWHGRAVGLSEQLVDGASLRLAADFELGRAHLAALHFEQAARLFESVVQGTDGEPPSAITGQVRGGSLSGLAAIAYYHDRFDAAASRARQAIAVAERTFGPTHANTLDARNILAAARMGSGAYGEAEEGFAEILAATSIDRSPDTYWAAYLNWGLAVGRQSGRLDEALGALARIERSHPSGGIRSRGLLARGRLLHEHGRSAEAHPLVLRALRTLEERDTGHDTGPATEGARELLSSIEGALSPVALPADTQTE